MKFKNWINILLGLYSLTIIAEGLSSSNKAFLRIFLVIIVFSIFIYKKKVFLINNRLKLFLFVITIPVLISILKYDFEQSILQYLMYFTTFVFVLFIYLTSKTVSINNILSITLPLVIIIFIFGIVLDYPMFWRYTYSDNYSRLGGIILNPNELGMLSSISAIICYDKFNRKSNIYLLFFCVSLVTLYYTYSRSSMIALTIALIFYSIKNKKYLNIISAVIICLFLFKDIFNIILPRSEVISDVVTLTGRSEIWITAITKIIPDNFFFGTGFQNFPGTNYGIAALMAHNTFIQLFVGSGFFIFLAGLYLVKLVLNNQSGVFYLIFIILLINSLTEFGFYGPFNHSVFLFIFLLFKSKHEKNYFAPNNS